MSIIKFFNEFLFGPAVPVALIAAGIYFSVSLKFFYIRHPIKVIRSMIKKRGDGGISPFRAATVALAGTLGVGNIVGVASAITLGGAGAVFWMWISALFAMILKYAEIVLAVRYRKTDGDRSYGGAMYYVKEGLGGGKFASFAAALFCVLCIINALGMGGMIQISAAADILSSVAGVPPVTTGFIGAILAVFAVSSGAAVLSRVTEKLVPVMSAAYMIMALLVIVRELDGIPFVLGMIFEDAFSFESAAGGIVGFFLSRALRFGTMRGILSNEAGCGTSPIAYAASNEKSPAEQGFWGIFEVFFDTIVLCSMSAFVILLSYDDPYVFGGAGGVMLTVRAFVASLGEWSSYILAAAVFLFAFATVICWAQYGLECVWYFSRAKAFGTIYLCVYFIFVVLGAVAAPEAVWEITDFALGGMTIINLFALCLMQREVKRETDAFFKPLK